MKDTGLYLSPPLNVVVIKSTSTAKVVCILFCLFVYIIENPSIKRRQTSLTHLKLTLSFSNTVNKFCGRLPDVHTALFMKTHSISSHLIKLPSVIYRPQCCLQSTGFHCNTSPQQSLILLRLKNQKSTKCLLRCSPSCTLILLDLKISSLFQPKLLKRVQKF